ncbi:MAG: hypothetical protein CMO55_07125 [Verrucomicrobiales bacterium]|nr:hypothetical protein [Verrucomicrobiales bacterium]
MKTKAKLTRSAAAALSLPAAIFGLTLTSLPANGQVKIEGGPGEVQIADGDGQPEPANPAPVSEVTVEVPTTPILDRDDEAVTVQPNPLTSTTVLVPVEEPEEATANDEISATVTETVVVENDDYTPAERKRLEWLEEQLEMFDGHTVARLSIPAEDLFEEKSAALTPESGTTLSQFTEYLALRDPEEIAVSYHYAPDTDTPMNGRKRQLQLVETLQLETVFGESNLTVNDPTADPATVYEDGKLGATMPSRVSIVEFTIR